MVGIFGQQVVHGIDQETGSAHRRVEYGITDVRVNHLDHEGADLARGAELAVERTGAKVHKQVFEDVTLHIRAELAEFESVQLVDHLLEHVGVDDFQDCVAEIFGYLGFILGK